MTKQEMRIARGAKPVSVDVLRDIVDGPGDPSYRMSMAEICDFSLACALVDAADEIERLKSTIRRRVITMDPKLSEDDIRKFIEVTVEESPIESRNTVDVGPEPEKLPPEEWR